MENPEALGFHQEQRKNQDNNKIGFVSNFTLFCTKLVSFCLYGSRNVISTKHYFQREYKIQNLKRYFQREENITKFGYEIQNPKTLFSTRV